MQSKVNGVDDVADASSIVIVKLKHNPTSISQVDINIDMLTRSRVEYFLKPALAVDLNDKFRKASSVNIRVKADLPSNSFKLLCQKESKFAAALHGKSLFKVDQRLRLHIVVANVNGERFSAKAPVNSCN